MIKKLFFTILLFIAINNLGFALNISPLLTNFRIENTNRNRVYFDSNTLIKSSGFQGFIISGKSIVSIHINEGEKTGHYFKVSEDFNFWDNSTIRYESGSGLQSITGEELPPFTLEYIINNISEPNANIKTIYLTTKGNDSNSGKTESEAVKTFQKAISLLPKNGGGILYVKAGRYKGVNITKNNTAESGTISKPNKIIGYKNVPGDLDGKSFYKYIPKNNNEAEPLNSAEYPVFDGVNRAEGTFYHAKNKKFIIWKNIAITNYKVGFDAWSKASYWHFENMVFKDFGSTSKKSGHAIKFGSESHNNNRFINIKSINSTSSHLLVAGNFNAFINCEAYTTEAYSKYDVAATSDYYYHMRGSNNLMYNSLAYKNTKNGWGHNGHGFCLKARDVKTEFNLVQNCEAVGIYGAYELRHPETQFNVVKNSISRADIDNRRSNTYQGTSCVQFLMGAKNNVVENMKGYYIDSAIAFGDNAEEKANNGAKNNIVRNSIFYNIKSVVLTFNANEGLKSIHKDNKIFNCTFYNSNKIYHNLSSSSKPISFVNFEIKNSIFQKVNSRGVELKGWVFTYNNFWNYWKSNGQALSGKGNVSFKSNFKSIKNVNFELQPSSKLIDVGVVIDQVKNDYLGSPRPLGDGVDIGAYEYKEATTSSINAGSDKNICMGQSVELVAVGEGPFNWNTGQTTKSIVVTPTETTQYSVSNGSSSDSVYVFVNELPVIDLGRDLEIKKGDKITISAPTGFASYNWSTGETTPSITVSPEQQTVYTIVVTNTNGCSSEDSIIVNVKEVEEVNTSQNQITVSKDQTICIGDSVVLEANGADSYLWSDGSTENSIEVSPSVTTNYSLLAKKDGEIKTFNVIVYIGNNCSDIDSDKEIVLYPNPTEGKVNIDFKGYELKNEKDELNMYIISLNGNILFKETVKNKTTAAELKRQFDLSSYSKGVYFFKLQDKDKTETKKIVLR